MEPLAAAKMKATTTVTLLIIFLIAVGCSSAEVSIMDELMDELDYRLKDFDGVDPEMFLRHLRVRAKGLDELTLEELVDALEFDELQLQQLAQQLEHLEKRLEILFEHRKIVLDLLEKQKQKQEQEQKQKQEQEQEQEQEQKQEQKQEQEQELASKLSERCTPEKQKILQDFQNFQNKLDGYIELEQIVELDKLQLLKLLKHHQHEKHELELQLRHELQLRQVRQVELPKLTKLKQEKLQRLLEVPKVTKQEVTKQEQEQEQEQVKLESVQHLSGVCCKRQMGDIWIAVGLLNAFIFFMVLTFRVFRSLEKQRKSGRKSHAFLIDDLGGVTNLPG